MMSNAHRGQRLALLSSAVVLLAACGGGGDSSPTAAPGPAAPAAPASPPPSSAPTTASGVVLLPLQPSGAPALGPATVCYDTDQNGHCDSEEPTTTADDTGAYTLTGLPTTQPADAAIVAHIPAGNSPAYTVQTPVSKPELISTLTTMVRLGVSQGMTLAEAEAAVARQLQVSTASLYRNYRTLTGADRAWFNTLGIFISQALQSGIPLHVGPSSTPSAGYEVTLFAFTDASNRTISFLHSTKVADATTGLIPYHVLIQSLRGGLQNFAAVRGSWALSPEGWKPNYSQGYTHSVTAGNPYVAITAMGSRIITLAHEVDVSGQAVSDVVGQVTAIGSTANTSSTVILPSAITPGSLTGFMPPGARVRILRAATMLSPTQYSEADRVNMTPTTLSGALSAYPGLAAGTAPDNTNTVLLGRTATDDPVNGTRGCSSAFTQDGAGHLVCPDSDVRATFDAANHAASFYLCDYLFEVTPGSVNCRSVGTADITLDTLEDGATPSLTFTNLPAAATLSLGGKVLIQRNGSIYKATPAFRPTSTATTVTSRLNGTAFAALASALNISAPNPSFTQPSPYMGVWQATYAGASSGTCEPTVVDAAGDLMGMCTPASGMNFTLAGTISTAGTASAASGVTGFTGQFSATSASGTWHDSGTSTGGTWSASKY